MKNNTRNLVFCLSLFVWAIGMLVSCKSASTPPPVKTENNNEKTTIIRDKDTVFITEKDSSYYKAFIDCINGKPVIKEPVKTPGKNLAAPNVNLNGNNLNVDCKKEAQEYYAKWQEKYIKEHQSTVIEIPVEVPKLVFRDKPLTWWQITQIWCGRIFLALLLLVVALFFIRSKISST